MINAAIFKAYDIRGVYPTDLNEDVAYKIGQAYTKVVKPNGKIAVGRDIRLHSETLQKSLIKGLNDAGVDVIDIGLISTEQLYFSVGFYGLAGGIQVTASHNSAEFNGMKMVRANAIPLSSDTGIFEIRDLVLADTKAVSESKRGVCEKKDVLDDYVDYLLKNFIDRKSLKSFDIAINPNFGFEGEILKKLIKVGKLPIKLYGLNDNPDGSFPKGKPDPLQQINREEFSNFISSLKVDFGAAWDADADRIFFYTGKGEFIEPYYTNPALIENILAKHPKAKIIYDPRYTWATIDATKENGGKPVLERVGHAFIKARMRKEDAVLGCETSGHTYFRDFWFADSGMLPFLLILEILSAENTSLDEMVQPYMKKYPISGEINTSTPDAESLIEKVKDHYGDGKISYTDGVSIEYPEWRTNLRVSNTESLLRLNIEAKTKNMMTEKRNEILKLIRQD